MKVANGQCLHVLLFGTFNERKFLLHEFRKAYDIVGFNANLVAYAPQGVAALVAALVNKLYFIDPQFHAFQQPIRTIMRKSGNKFVVKDSIRKLADFYGSHIGKVVGRAPIRAGTLSIAQKEELTGKVIDFQWNVLEDASEDQEYKEFLDFVDSELRPGFLIAPYFFVEPDNLDNELLDNVDFVRIAREHLNRHYASKDIMLFAEVVIHKQLLAYPEVRQRIAQEIGQTDADGVLIWIDDFSEVLETEKLLEAYVDFLSRFRQVNQKPLINLHGSYFSTVLSGKSVGLLAGVGHGVEYGESRPVIPVGGGVPLAKFYFPRFHKRVDYDPDASNILLEMGWIKDRQTYLRNVCSCPVCEKTISHDVMEGFQAFGQTRLSTKIGRAYPTPDAMTLSRRHYLHNKNSEFLRCKRATLDEIVTRLSRAEQVATRLQKIHSFDHLAKWVNVLRGLAHSPQ